VVPKSLNCNATHLGIFTCNVVPCDERLRFVSYCLIKRALASNCSPASGFSPTASGCQIAAMSSLYPAELSGALPFG
jgi:hypothetical protein